MPARGQRAGLRLSVTDDARDQQLGVVECGAECMRERIPELSAFVDRSWRLGRGMARDATRKRELTKELSHPLDVLTDLRIQLAVRPLEVGLGDVRWTAMTWAGHEDGIQFTLSNRSIEMDVHEVQTRRRSEVPEETRLDVFGPQRFAEQRVVEQIDLTDGEVVRRTPVAVHRGELTGRHVTHA